MAGSSPAMTLHATAPRLSRLLGGISTANAIRAINLFLENQTHANLTFRSNRASRTADRVAPPELEGDVRDPSPLSAATAPGKKLDEKRFSSKSKFSPRKSLKFHKTAKEMFGKT